MSLEEFNARIEALRSEARVLAFRDKRSETDQERWAFLDIELPRMIRLRDACFDTSPIANLNEHKHAPAAPILSVASSRPSPPALQVVPYASPSAPIPSPPALYPLLATIESTRPFCCLWSWKSYGNSKTPRHRAFLYLLSFPSCAGHVSIIVCWAIK